MPCVREGTELRLLSSMHHQAFGFHSSYDFNAQLNCMFGSTWIVGFLAFAPILGQSEANITEEHKYPCSSSPGSICMVW